MKMFYIEYSLGDDVLAEYTRETTSLKAIKSIYDRLDWKQKFRFKILKVNILTIDK